MSDSDHDRGNGGGKPRPPAARVLALGARGAERLAEATGVDRAVEDAMEEAIVRALRSEAVERALVRLIEQNAVQSAVERALTSDEVAGAVVDALDTELADRVWVEVLASEKAQMLVERVAEAPEVRAAITEQGAGLVTDVGHRLTAITESLDDSAERLARRILRRPLDEEEHDEVGLLTRALAAAVDFGIIAALLTLGERMLIWVLPGTESLPAWLSVILGALVAGSYFVAFWSLIGQTPGMRFLSIHLDAGGSREIGPRRALTRLFGAVIALLPLGIGILSILTSPTRRGWHDRLAGTVVVYDARKRNAPWAQPERRRGAEPIASAIGRNDS